MCYPLDVDQVGVSHVVGRRGAAVGPAAKREGRRQSVAEADAALRPGTVDQHSAHWHLPREGHLQPLAARVDDRRMAAAAVAEDLQAKPDAVVFTVSGEQ